MLPVVAAAALRCHGQAAIHHRVRDRRAAVSAAVAVVIVAVAVAVIVEAVVAEEVADVDKFLWM